MKHIFAKLALSALCSMAFTATAAPLSYTFTSVGGHVGSVTFDSDAALAPSYYYGLEGIATTYLGTSFILDGVAHDFPAVAIYDNFLNYDNIVQDGIVFLADGVELHLFGSSSLFSSGSLAAAGNLVLSDYIASLDTQLIHPQGFSRIATLQAVAVPEPQAYMLALASLIMGGLMLRATRKS